MNAGLGSAWYVAQTRPHVELKASQHLQRQGFATYLPRYLKHRRHARRADRIAAPLFPGYVFVSIDLGTQRWLSIDSTFGVSRLIRAGDRPVPVLQSIIDTLKCREDASGLVALERRPKFSPGDKIRMVGGAFCDCLGLYEDMGSRERVAILLDLLGRKVRAFVDADFIEAA
jgi:transcriptional antiterminator RfaH